MMPPPIGFSFTAALIMGLLGAAHCVGMCGGIMGALTMAVPPQQRHWRHLWPTLVAYNLGRILSYVTAGLALGLAGYWLTHNAHQVGALLRHVAGIMLILMGLYIAGWYRGLRHLERGGQHLWRHLAPLGKNLLPVRSSKQALLLGALWGWLPCGLVYSALTWALVQEHWWQSGAIMLGFGLGTAPAVLATGVAADRLRALIQNRWFRGLSGLSIILYGLWTLPSVHRYFLLWLHH